MDFSSLTKNAQVNRLRKVAGAMLAHYPLEVGRIKLLTHLFNTTFAVTASDGRKFALRINTNSKRTPEEMNAEVAWVSALSHETDLWVPEPQLTREGRLTVEEACEAMGRDLRGVLYSWLPGPNAWGRMTPDIAQAMGEATRKLHVHGANFLMPEGCELKPLKDPLFGYSYILHEKAPDLNHALFEKTFEDANDLLTRLKKSPQMPIHYDVHMGNVKWHRGRLSVFDFDDCLMGLPVFDAYVSIFYLRSQPEGRALEAAYWEGLESSPRQLGVTEDQFELLVASRSILLANEMYRWDNAETLAIAPKYGVVTEQRLSAFYETGIFDPLVARMS